MECEHDFTHYDFAGWATKNDLLCSDGRIIRHNAFSDCDGKVVPLIWNHRHDDPDNVLGWALLENRPEGVYTYGAFNSTERGQNARELVRHGDIEGLSIYANKLKQEGPNVLHGMIREVSLVLAGANPGAYIESVIAHSDDGDEEAIIFTGEEIMLEHSDMKEAAESEESSEKKEEKTLEDVFDTLSEEQKTAVYAIIAGILKDNGVTLEDATGEEKAVSHACKDDDEDLEHAKEESAEDKADENETIGDIFETLTEKQKNAVYAIIGEALSANEEADDTNEKDEGEKDMKHSVFDSENNTEVLSHSEMEAIFTDAKRCGSLREAVLAHGITDIENLFPEATAVGEPAFVSRDVEWVDVVMKNVHHTPFSRIKSMYANITADEARAKGFTKGNEKTDEVFAALKRTTSPTTIYKKQTLNRDDVLDITDFDAVAWLKSEMRTMLNEELARAILVGDGRESASNDKIDETCIRPIYGDTSAYVIRKDIEIAEGDTDDDVAKAFIRTAVKARKEYKGSGNLICFVTEDMLTNMLLMEDLNGRVIYDDVTKLATALRVKQVVSVPVLEDYTREDDDEVEHTLAGIIVDLRDYNVGADKGGEVNMFDDFDIDYNAQKYLIETRCSGAMIKPYSAIVIETVAVGD